jgi:hypothetical protein
MRFAWLAFFCVFGTETALAHDLWIAHGRYTNKMTGELCCGENDCVMIAEEDVKITPGGYLLKSGEVVPYEETMKSEDGQYWRCARFDKAKSRRCFFAPNPASE